MKHLFAWRSTFASRSTLAILAMLLPVLSACAQESQEAVGLKVGETVPEFALKDQDGNEHKLSELVGEHKLAIVLFRSVVW